MTYEIEAVKRTEGDSYKYMTYSFKQRNTTDSAGRLNRNRRLTAVTIGVFHEFVISSLRSSVVIR